MKGNEDEQLELLIVKEGRLNLPYDLREEEKRFCNLRTSIYKYTKMWNTSVSKLMDTIILVNNLLYLSGLFHNQLFFFLQNPATLLITPLIGSSMNETAYRVCSFCKALGDPLHDIEISDVGTRGSCSDLHQCNGLEQCR
ncbi:hypothetical protein F2Q68_00039061 [Brassica cretica]|uniref:Uncharacterized protein n=2 Tax=Brassica cretica TaxID=69181 RepID=A0ABQ7AE53_BRACR|nr:hypothetical protein F2Q68_00039061 [Brassica cretica]KAF3495696.1 hypothetical protein DY000_02052645 [Brassica cretica]